MIVQGVCNSYKKEILEGIHLFSHTYKIALFTSEAELNANTTSFIGLKNEVENGNGYTTGGIILMPKDPSLVNDLALLNLSQNPVWLNASFTARGAIIYNDSLEEKNTVGVLDFGQDYTCENENFEIELPVADETVYILEIV